MCFHGVSLIYDNSSTPSLTQSPLTTMYHCAWFPAGVRRGRGSRRGHIRAERHRLRPRLHARAHRAGLQPARPDYRLPQQQSMRRYAPVTQLSFSGKLSQTNTPMY